LVRIHVHLSKIDFDECSASIAVRYQLAIVFIKENHSSGAIVLILMHLLVCEEHSSGGGAAKAAKGSSCWLTNTKLNDINTLGLRLAYLRLNNLELVPLAW
jgi:hypothetical protein